MADTHEHTDVNLAALPVVDVSGIRKVSWLAAVIGLPAFGVLGFLNLSFATEYSYGVRDFFFAWLCGFVFWASLPFGALGLLMIGYVTTASWQIVLRRLFQAATRTWYIVALMFVPVLVSLFLMDGKISPYWWSESVWSEAYEKSADIAKERGMPVEAVTENMHKVHDFLSPGFFAVRFAIYMVILGTMITLLNKWAIPAEDQDCEASKTKIYNLSAPGIVVWGLTLTIAATDWVMSVEPTWFSSMFPIIYGMNMFVTTFAICIFLIYTLNLENAAVMSVLKTKFRIDMASLMLALTLVWAYGTFSQYMLVWAGNLPEEIVYFRKRGDHGWQYLAYFLMAFHWIIPFFCITMRSFKTNPKSIRRICVILLMACIGDVIWWLLPAVGREQGGTHVGMAIAAIIGMGGIWGMSFAGQLNNRSILPANSEGKFLANWGHHH